jgi:hypothetical protein
MKPAGTVVAFGHAAALAAAELDATALACEVLGPGEDLFRRIKQAEPGSLLLVLVEDAGDPGLAAAAKAARILRRRGGGEALIVLPAAEANPGPDARERLRWAAEQTAACVVQPVRSSWADAVRCFLEPLSVFGLVGVDAGEVHKLARAGSFALLHTRQETLEEALGLPGIREVLLSCRLRPNATLREVDEPAARLREMAPKDAHLVFAGPEVSAADEGPRSVAAVLF